MKKWDFPGIYEQFDLSESTWRYKRNSFEDPDSHEALLRTELRLTDLLFTLTEFLRTGDLDLLRGLTSVVVCSSHGQQKTKQPAPGQKMQSNAPTSQLLGPQYGALS